MARAHDYSTETPTQLALGLSSNVLKEQEYELSKVWHVISVIAGFIGVLMWFLLIFAWFTSAKWFAVTTDLMLMIGCTIFSFLAAIWLQIATIHHMMLEKRGKII